MEDFIGIVANNGFAIAVSAYLLVRMEQRIADLKDSIASLDKNIHLLTDKIRD